MRALPIIVAVGITSCATPGTGPHEQSVSGHEQAARKADEAAAAHEAQIETNPTTRCDQIGPTTGSRNQAMAPCWTPSTNKSHREEAERQRRAAAAHRAASSALQKAEEQACAGIEPQDRDISPFFHREDIVRVQEETASGNQSGADLARGVPGRAVIGATVYFRAVEGLTAEWLQQTVNCHLARNAALGHDVPEMDYCPLVPRGVSATVKPTRDGFAVTILAPDPKTGAEVLRRARALIDG